MKNKKRFALLLCAEDPEYVKKMYGGYFGVFMRLLGDGDGDACGCLNDSGKDDEEEYNNTDSSNGNGNGGNSFERWEVYRVCEGEFPQENNLEEYHGFVISGSCNDAHGDDPWICRLVSLLQTLNSMRKKVLGICFGHQILCRALGGKTGRAEGGWDIGVTKVNLLLSSSSSHKQQQQLSVIECHRDEVLELPEGAELLAWSDKTRVEMFRCGDHMMGIQGHPEYTEDILLQLIHRLLHNQLIQPSLANSAITALKSSRPDTDAWKNLCKTFLKQRNDLPFFL